MGTGLRGDLFALHRLAVEGVVDRLTKRLPQLLLELAVQRHGLGFGLPALLQQLDGIHAQTRRSPQDFGFGDQGLTPL